MRLTLRSAVVGALAFSLAAGPGVAFAAEAAAAPQVGSTTAAPTLAQAAAARAAAALPAAALAPAQAGTSGSGKSFLRSGKGVAVLVLMAVAVGYTVHSTDKDRVRSPIR
jgi:hypothetical protein